VQQVQGQRLHEQLLMHKAVLTRQQLQSGLVSEFGLSICGVQHVRLPSVAFTVGLHMACMHLRSQ
jgi:hypothetical protein